MKNILFLLVILVFGACSQKKEATFTLQGNVINTKTDYIILFQENDIERKISTLIDTIYLDENGSFSADFNNEPHYYTLVINDNKKIPLAIDKEQNINIKVDDTETSITGSKDTDLLIAYENLREKSLDRLVKSIRKQISDENKTENPSPKKIDSLGQLEIKNYDLHLDELNTFIKEKMGTSIAIYPTSLRWKGEDNIPFFDSLVDSFENSHPNLTITEKLREKVTRLQQTSIGGKVPDIIMNTADNKTVSLFSINKKYTLIDFWASWCGPCRRESEILNRLYKKYKDDGFEIYGVSLDTNKQQWLKAIEKDNRNWANVSSLEGLKTPAAYNFAVTALPMNYVIDSKGRIIAKNLHGAELLEFIDNLMQ
ncbi:TlpA disulfide reductase family protein [Aureibaculum sp. 2210JD6-5]|uniref:TlpA disulfide reductase family protein n=1 Tax=Aureibaculum sp. 2210JD6-5 TaxID=3103957 RepID=UPI002AAD6AA1|nr:TlpA disulfide reductase family protein [Aureibaculum sp. 2210JD6-5]MDY7394839.1 TlpA disulfide reductase family protein [Aureibaculum sp. 2210JD6-5]